MAMAAARCRVAKPLDAAAELDDQGDKRSRTFAVNFFLGLCNWMARAQNYLRYMEQLC